VPDLAPGLIKGAKANSAPPLCGLSIGNQINVLTMIMQTRKKVLAKETISK